MPTELTLILILVGVFIVAIRLGINIGLVALVAAFIAGPFIGGIDVEVVAEGFPSAVFIMLLGITLLLGAAAENGTINWLVSKLLSFLGERLVILPWALFFIALIGSSFGPLMAPVLFVIGFSIAKQVECNPLLMGVMVVHGSQAGLFSPIAAYGVLFQSLLPEAQGAYDPLTMYLIVVAFHVLIAGGAFVAFGGRELAGKTVDRETLSKLKSGVGTLNPARVLTLLSFLALVVVVVAFRANIGVVALVLAFMLMLIAPKEEREKPINHVPWSIMIVIIGVLSYVHVMEETGAVDWLAGMVRELGSPTLAAIMLCILSAIVTALTSTFGTFGVLIPLAAPFIAAGELDPTTLLAAMAISAAVTDISPFSTMGALFLGAAEGFDRRALLRKMLRYVFAMILIVPVVTWLALIVPGW